MNKIPLILILPLLFVLGGCATTDSVKNAPTALLWNKCYKRPDLHTWHHFTFYFIDDKATNWDSMLRLTRDMKVRLEPGTHRVAFEVVYVPNTDKLLGGSGTFAAEATIEINVQAGHAYEFRADTQSLKSEIWVADSDTGEPASNRITVHLSKQSVQSSTVIFVPM